MLRPPQNLGAMTPTRTVPRQPHATPYQEVVCCLRVVALQSDNFMPQEAGLPNRRSVRIKSFDYSQAGMYFVTVCTHERKCIFGEIVGDEFVPNALGKIVNRCWREIPGHFPGVGIEIHAVMPNHFHGLISLPKLARAEERAQHAAPLRARSGAVEAVDALARRSVGAIMRSFKAAVAKDARETLGLAATVWQRGYYEHVIRDKRDFQNVWEYIRWNPLRWAQDEENPRFSP